MVAVRDRLDRLGHDTVVVLVTFTTVENLADYSSNLDLAFPVLVDADRACYRAYGLGRGRLLRVYGRRVLKQYLDIVRSDGLSGLRRPTEDTLQLGGDFVIDRTGKLSYVFRGEGPDDRPSVDELVEAIELADH